MKRALKVILCLVLLVMCAFGAILVDNTTVSLEKVDYYSDQLPSQFYGYRIMCIADFHDSYYFDQVSKLVNEEHPDAVLLLGDMTSLSHPDWNNLLRLVKRIDTNVPVYGVQGNHESMRPDSQNIVNDLKNFGVTMLDNNKVTLYKGDASIDLIGVNDIAENEENYDSSWTLEQMRLYLENVIEEDRYTLLACHRANLYPYLSDLNAELMLSGHMHGGILRLPKVGGVFDVDGSLFPDYDKGFFNEGEMELYVSPGCDFDLNKMRIFNGPSVTLLTLKR